jgi:hypothetical protein
MIVDNSKVIFMIPNSWILSQYMYARFTCFYTEHCLILKDVAAGPVKKALR